MKRTIRTALKSATTEKAEEYRVRVIGTNGAVLTEIDDLPWEAIRPHVSEYDGRFARIEVMPASGLRNPE